MSPMADNFSRIPDITEESERTRGLGDEALVHAESTRPNRAGTRMLSVRMPLTAIEAIEKLAADRDLPVSALVRSWILDGLEDPSTQSVPEALDRLAADVDRLRDIVGR